MGTNFPSGVSSYGVPVLGGGGSLALMGQGNRWFVKPGSGNDSNDGTTPQSAFATLAKAHNAATANQNDVVFLYSESNTAADTTDYQSATLTWSKDLTHLVGICSGSAWSHRARIAQLSTATGVTNLVTVSADGCYFANFSIFHGVADATSLVALKVTGTRNVFENCHIGGVGDATMSAAGAASLKIDAGAENVFRNCTIGLDTATRDADATEILFD